MSRKKTTVIALVVLLPICLLTFFRQKFYSSNYWSTQADQIMQRVEPFHLTNTWVTVAASGRSLNFFGHKDTDYFLLQKSSVNAYQELINELEHLDNSRSLNKRFMRSGFLYLPDVNADEFFKNNRTMYSPSWWHPEEDGTGIAATIQTNINKKTFVVDISSFNHITNAIMYTHIIVLE